MRMRRFWAGAARLRPWQVVIALSVISATVGCGNGAEGVSVEGRVVYQDKPISNGALTFFPASGRPITATLSDDGAYSCRLPPGEYRVAITVGVSLPPGWKEGDAVPPPTIELPARYSSRLETPLTATVNGENRSQSIDFTLR
jgi:hypothetical protein